MSTTHGWTTWDPSSIAVWEHLPSGLRCQLVMQDTQGQSLAPTSWELLEEALPDDAGRSLAHLRLLVGDAEVEMECGGEGDVSACHIVNILGQDLTAHWEISGPLDGWQVHREEYDVIFAPEQAALPEDAASFVLQQREAVLRALPHGEWRLTEPLAAMEATLAANTFVLADTGEEVTVSRHEWESSGKWRIPNWQTFLTALGIAYIDPLLAINDCKTALRRLAVDGMLGAESTAKGPRRDISNPPVAAYAIWKIFQMTGEQTLLEEAYPVLLRWHDWWMNFRDGNHNRLLNWASVEETGMPGHPLYESAPSDPRMGILQIDDVGLCSLWALDAFALMRMAMQLNDLDRATHLETEINEIASHMNLLLWNHVEGSYRSRDWDGFSTDRDSATVFLALAGAIPTPTRADRLVKENLSALFNAPFLVPTLGTRDEDFARQQPWCGRVSPLLNYLICEGLRQFGEDEVAEKITLSGLDLISGSWDDHHQVFGSYNALTGSGDDLAQDPLAPDGLLFSALGIGMLIDAEPWNGLRMGNLRGVDLAINDLPLRGDRYDVASGPWGFSITRNGDPWFNTDQPAIIRNLSQTERDIPAESRCRAAEKSACASTATPPGSKSP